MDTVPSLQTSRQTAPFSGADAPQLPRGPTPLRRGPADRRHGLCLRRAEPRAPGPTPAPHLGPNERACPRAAVSTSPLGRPRKTRCGEHTWPLSEGAASELGAVSRDCALVCALFSWGSHPGGTQARGDLAASLPRQRSGLGQAAPPPRGDFRGRFQGLPGGGGWGQFCACVTLRKPTRFRHSPSRDPPPLALPVCTSTRGRADGLGGPRGRGEGVAQRLGRGHSRVP